MPANSRALYITHVSNPTNLTLFSVNVLNELPLGDEIPDREGISPDAK